MCQAINVDRLTNCTVVLLILYTDALASGPVSTLTMSHISTVFTYF